LSRTISGHRLFFEDFGSGGRVIETSVSPGGESPDASPIDTCRLLSIVAAVGSTIADIKLIRLLKALDADFQWLGVAGKSYRRCADRGPLR
jgi:hypothetical protein